MPSWWPSDAEVEYVVDEDGGCKEEKASILDVEAHVLGRLLAIQIRQLFRL